MFTAHFKNPVDAEAHFSATLTPDTPQSGLILSRSDGTSVLFQNVSSQDAKLLASYMSQEPFQNVGVYLPVAGDGIQPWNNIDLENFSIETLTVSVSRFREILDASLNHHLLLLPEKDTIVYERYVYALLATLLSNETVYVLKLSGERKPFRLVFGEDAAQSEVADWLHNGERAAHIEAVRYDLYDDLLSSHVQTLAPVTTYRFENKD